MAKKLNLDDFLFSYPDANCSNGVNLIEFHKDIMNLIENYLKDEFDLKVYFCIGKNDRILVCFNDFNFDAETFFISLDGHYNSMRDIRIRIEKLLNQSKRKIQNIDSVDKYLYS